MAERPSRRGQILMGVLVLVMILTVLVPLMVFYVQREAAWTAKQSRNTTAFHLAEAGLEKGLMGVTLSPAAWDGVQAGQQIAGLRFDAVYSDVPGGTYTVSVSSGPDDQEVTILSVGRDALKRELRGLKAIYSRNAVVAALYANGINAAGGMNVHWGPIQSLGAISLAGSANVCYPRKFAVGAITTSGTSPQHCHDSWTSPASPCTDAMEWWAYNCTPGVPPPPTINFAEYKTEAQAASCPTSGLPNNFPPGAVPAGSCYWPTSASPSFSGIVMTSSRTIYVEKDLGVSNGFIWGSVIVQGSLSFSGSGKGVYAIPDAFTPDGIPAKAWVEYEDLDTPAAAEFYGDAGYEQLNPSFSFGVGGNPPMQSATKDAPSLRGFAYVGGAFNAAGGTSLHGVLYSPNSISAGAGGFTVYYDDVVASRVKLLKSALARVWWQDIVVSAWPGP